MSSFVSFVRVFYTVVLILLGLGLIVYYPLMLAASANGHGSFSIFSLQGITPALLFALLLVSRVLQSRSPKWLLLGLPTLLLIVGFAGFIAISMWTTNQRLQIVGGSEQSYSLAPRTIANSKVNITVHPCDSTSTDYCFGSLYTRQGSKGSIEVWDAPAAATDIYYGVVVSKPDRKHLYIVSVEQNNDPNTNVYTQIHNQIETELLDGQIIKS